MKKQLSFYIREIQNIANKGFFYLFTAQGLIIIIGFASQFFVARFLDPTDLGRIKIMQTYIALTALICGLGFDTSMLKLASEKSDINEKKKLYQAAFLVTLVSFIVIYFILFVLSSLSLISSDPVISDIFPLYLLFLLPLSLQSTQMAYFQAQMQIKKMAKLQFIIKVLSILLIVFFTFLFQLQGYIITIILTGFLAVVIFELGIKNLSLRNFFMPEGKLIRSMWQLARYSMIANIVSSVAATLDVYIINYLVADRKEVGYYMFALTIISIYQLVPRTIQQVAFPYFSQQSTNHEKWHKSYLKYNKLNHILVFSMVLGGLLVVPILVNVAFSGKYDSSIYYFVFLSIAWMIKYAAVIKPTAIMGHGRFDLNFMSSVIILIVTYPIIFFAIKYYGLQGAIVSMTLAAMISYGTDTFIFWRFGKNLKS